MVIVESAGISDIGKKREANEDRIFVDDAMGLYLVADGMGGHQAGEIASALVVTSVQDFLMGKCPENTTPLPDTRLSLPAGRLLAGIQWSNAVVHQTAMARVDCRGMGSTVAAVCFSDATLVAANVGDSPIYLVRNGGIDLLSVPHSLQAEMAPGAHAAFFSNVLTRAVGSKPAVEADICELSCYKGDILVICSDGLSTKVALPEILSIVTSRAPAHACRALVDLSNERGGDDNISIVIVRVTDVRRNHSSPLTRWVAQLKQRLFSRGPVNPAH
jgi:PPM family protein phosphatase